AIVELEYQLTMNNSSRQPKSNPNITPKASFSTLNSWLSHLPFRGAMAELEYQLTTNNSSRQP
ncbi:Hypothetical protein FKW44_004691, partial [Caligus rogercresseyi]